MFVHSLVKVIDKDKHGWKAPAELGDKTPHYISFVGPLNENNELSDEYVCEVVKTSLQGRSLEAHKLKKAGTDSFILEVSQNLKIRFHLRGVGRDERRLRYLGSFAHDD